ncbi:SyrB [Vibrio nigripulchritudo ATCC 27043]|uniref:PglL family O-oligosaccharyltransferase n=1 Tax=Vibrio nigripulchritudo TaxID=28173 RepID=UPI00021C29C8|nr:PglL family O-oligosaccharyltransferase [Vibrio nigripulchritudo]EGU60937.1 SyrB [Vibrio nigripulchritudo ATCC 27043]
MATLLVKGTQLEADKIRTPLNRKFLLALAVTFIIAMNFLMANPGGSGLALSYNPATWITLSIALAMGLYQTSNRFQIRYSKMGVVLLLCSLVLSAPLFFPNTVLEESTGRILGLWAGIILFFSLQQFQFSNKQKQRLLWFVLFAAVLQVAIGYIQFLVLEPGNMFGYPTEANRPYGIFQQPNVFASFIATGLVLSGYLLARQPQKYRRKFWQLIFLATVPMLCVSMLVIVASRTAWLGASLAVLMVLPYLIRFSTPKRVIAWVASIAVGIALGLTVPKFASSNFDSLLQDKKDLQSLRDIHFPQAIDMIIEKPFTGYGYGQFESSYLLYTARQHQLNPQYPPAVPALDHPHNELMLWGVEGGIVAIIAILLAGFYVIYKASSARKGTKLAMLALFVPIAVHTQLEYPFYHSAIHWVTFVILLYWLDQRTARYKTVKFSVISKVTLRVASLVLPLLTLFYMGSTLHTNYVLTEFEKSQPRNPEILDRVTNPVAWKDRYDWDVYSTYLTIGLYTGDKSLIEPYIEWSQDIIKRKPRPAFYNNLIVAYRGMGNESKATQIQQEAQYLFPKHDFSNVRYSKESQAIITNEEKAAE